MKTNRQIKPAVGYVRTASVVQAEEGNSLEHQEQRIKEYCKEKGIELIGIFIDSAKSGGNLVRDSLNLILSLIGRGKVKQVICTDISRISRNSRDYLKLKKYFKEHNTELITINGFGLTDDISSNFVDEIITIVGTLEQAVKRARRVRGMEK